LVPASGNRPSRANAAARRNREAAVDIDRAAQPRHCFFLFAKVELRQTGKQTPQVGSAISGTEAQRLLHVTFGLLSSAEQNLTIANLGVRASKISVQSQGPLALSHAHRNAFGLHLDCAEQQMSYLVSGLSAAASHSARSSWRGKVMAEGPR
jgi:hypothetical protein